MPQKQELLQQHDARAKKESGDSLEVCPRVQNEKFIVQVQLCIRCGRTFPYKKGRKSCPYCQTTLKTRAMVLKAP